MPDHARHEALAWGRTPASRGRWWDVPSPLASIPTPWSNDRRSRAEGRRRHEKFKRATHPCHKARVAERRVGVLVLGGICKNRYSIRRTCQTKSSLPWQSLTLFLQRYQRCKTCKKT
jgi:hypothetical protein